MTQIYKEYPGLLTPKECQDIIDIWPTLDRGVATTTNGRELLLDEREYGSNLRRGTTAFPNSARIPHWDKIISAINNYNIEQQINLNGVYEVQMAKYVKGDYFNKHQDISVKQWSRMVQNDNTRKISVSINLSAPEAYKGGELIFFTEKTKDGSNGIEMNKQQGTLMAFPSYCEHQVLELVTGIRFALVIWAKGPYWK